MSNRPMSNNFTKAPPLATVRREQASYDPLFDHLSGQTRGSSSSPKTEGSNRNSDNDNSYPPTAGFSSTPFASSRLSTGGDIVEMMAEMILQDTRIRPLNANEVSMDKQGLINLANNAAWTQVARFSSSILASSTQKQLSSQDYYCVLLLRYEALYRLKMFDELLSELTNLLSSNFSRSDQLSVLFLDGNLFDIYCSFRILRYEANVQSGQSQAGFRELQDTQEWLRDQLKPDSDKDAVRAWYWLQQIELNFINFYIRSRNWKMALQLHRKILIQINDLLAEYQPSSSDALDLTAAKVMLLCKTTRLLLQIGGSKSAKIHFEEASALISSNPVLNSDGYLQSLLLVTQGLIFFSEDKYDKAAETFSTFLDGEWSKLYENVSRVVAQPVDVLNKPKAFLSLLLQAKDENLLSSAINNYAICCLYMKRNSESMLRMEKLIGSNPPKYMTDPIVFNLCTMYDLSFAPDVSLAKKKALQKISVKYGLNDPILNWRSFRLN